MLDLKAFRRGAASLADLLPYAFLVDDGVVLTKDGSMLAAWEFRGKDTASSTPEELAHVSEQVNQALMMLDSGWMMQVDAVRNPATAYPEPELSHFPDKISVMIDEERRAFFSKSTCFETRTILTLTFKPTVSSTAAMLGDRQTFEKVLERFNQDITNFESILGGVLELTRLNEYEEADEHGSRHRYSDLLSHIQECLTGELQPIMLPRDCAMFLDNLLGSEDLIGGLEPRLGAKEIAAISIDGFPESSWPAILDLLTSLPLSYRFNLRFIFKDQQEAIAEVEGKRKEWGQKKWNPFDIYFNNPNARANRDAAVMEEDAQQAKARAQSGDVGFGKLTSTVILLHKDREFLHECARYVQNILRNRMGFGSRVETYNALEAWRGSLPGDWFSNMRDALISTRNLSHLMPLASVWPGAHVCPCPFYPPNSPPLMVCTTGGSTPFRFNLHAGDLGHTLILGPTGAGKSTFLALLCAQFRRYQGAQVFAFDMGMSMFPLCMAVGGAHYDIGGDDSKLAFAPLRHIDESDSEFAWACDWLCGLLEIQGGAPLTAEEREVVALTARKLCGNPPDERTIYHYMNLLSYGSESRLRSALSPFCDAGPMAKYMDAPQDNFGLSDFLVFEIEELMKMGDNNAVPILLYLFHCIEKSLDGRPTIIVLDEAWVMFGHPVCRAMVREWLKVMRKKNCAVVMATQSLSDAAGSGILDVVAESCPTKVYLANLAARDSQKGIYQTMGLNATQIEIIAQGVEKRDYYVEARGLGRRQIQLALKECPKTLAFVGSSGKEDIATIKSLISRYGDEWPQHWLDFKKA